MSSQLDHTILARFFFISIWLMIPLRLTADYAPDRYQLIIERGPFGNETVGSSQQDPHRNELDESVARNFSDTYRLCMLMHDPCGNLRAALVHRQDKRKRMILSAGERRDGIELLSINLAGSAAVFQVQGRSVTLQMHNKNHVVSRRAQNPLQAHKQDRQTNHDKYTERRRQREEMMRKARTEQITRVSS